MKKLLAFIVSLFVALSSQGRIFGYSSSAPEFDDLDGRTHLLEIHCIDQDEDGRIWFGTDKQLYSYDGYDFRACPYAEGNLMTNCLLVSGSRIFVGTNQGLFIYHLEDGHFERCIDFTQIAVRSLLRVSDTLYVGTLQGLYCFDLGTDSLSPRLVEGTARLAVYAMACGEEELLMGTDSSYYVYNTKSGTLKYSGHDIDDDSQIVSSIHVVASSHLYIGGARKNLERCSLDSGQWESLGQFNVVKTISHDIDGNLIIGTDIGLFAYDMTARKSFRLRSEVTYATFLDRDNNLWLGTDNGLLLVRQNHLFSQLSLPEGSEDALFFSALRDSHGRLWLSSSKGLMLTSDPKGDLWFRQEDSFHHLTHNKIKDVVETSDGRIVASLDMGYLVYDEASRQMTRHTIEGTNNWNYDLCPDGDGFWMTSFDGLVHLDTEARIYTLGEGIAENDIAQVEKTSDGTVYVLTRDQRVCTLDREKEILKELDLPLKGRPDRILVSRDDVLWVAYRGGLMRLTPDGATYETRLGDSSDGMVIDMIAVADYVLGVTPEGLFVVGKDGTCIREFPSSRRYLKLYFDAQSSRVLLLTRGRIDTISLEAIVGAGRKSGRQVRITGIKVNEERECSPRELGGRRLENRQNNLSISLSDYDYGNSSLQRFVFRLRGSAWTAIPSGNKILLTSLPPGRYHLEVSAKGQEGQSVDSLDFRILRPWYLSTAMILLYLAALALVAFWFVHSLHAMRSLRMEKERREVALRQAKEKEDFFVRVAHDFKTPLSLIIGPLSRLISEVKSDGVLKSLRLAQDNALKLNQMIHSTLDLYSDSTTSAGAVPDSSDLMKVDVDFSELSHSLVSSYSELYPKLEFVVDCQPEGMILSLDLTKMETILDNLISNACKYTKDGGTVILTALYDGGKLKLTVSDTGIGIPREELPLVFNRFFESSRTKEGNYDSTGVGLSIIRSYVEQLGGEVCADSDDNGTSFGVVLPCAQSQAPSDAPMVKASEGKPLVVIVDDNPQICSFLESSFESSYRCISVHNGKSGLKLCKDVIPDLIIADVMMPVMDGLQMCKALREYAPLSTVPIILLTAKGGKDTEIQSLNLNIDAFIPKPFDFQILSLKVQQLLSRHSRVEASVRMKMLSEVQAPSQLSYDEKYLQKVTRLIEEHIEDSSLNVAKLCELGGFSDKQLYRKIKQMTGLSTVEYIRSIRLKKSALLLQKGGFTVAEVMYSVGFSSMSYFCRAFTAAYGKAPSVYMKEKTS